MEAYKAIEFNGCYNPETGVSKLCDECKNAVTCVLRKNFLQPNKKEVWKNYEH